MRDFNQNPVGAILDLFGDHIDNQIIAWYKRSANSIYAKEFFRKRNLDPFIRAIIGDY